MTEKLKTEKSDGKKRQFLKLISMNEIAEAHHSFLVDYCFEALTSAKEPTSVRVYAMQILFNISEKEPGLNPNSCRYSNTRWSFMPRPESFPGGKS
jgi:hypothetical protein